jgi:DHA1 family bicyclomycin/chloramphenicol resistance-like MFS transporter
MLSFIQMMSFALVSGFVAPLLFDSAFKLACGVTAGTVLSFIAWRLSLRMQGSEVVRSEDLMSSSTSS